MRDHPFVYTYCVTRNDGKISFGGGIHWHTSIDAARGEIYKNCQWMYPNYVGINIEVTPMEQIAIDAIKAYNP